MIPAVSVISHVIRSAFGRLGAAFRRRRPWQIASTVFHNAYLPASIGQAFIEKYQNNLDHNEIGEKMNLKKSTIDRYLSIGTKQIQELHDQFFGDKDE